MAVEDSDVSVRLTELPNVTLDDKIKPVFIWLVIRRLCNRVVINYLLISQAQVLFDSVTVTVRFVFPVIFFPAHGSCFL